MAESGDFLGRAATQSLSGGIENLIEEAVKLRIFTDSNGDPLDGSKRYVLTFNKDMVFVLLKHHVFLPHSQIVWLLLWFHYFE